jgi:hypothetical protein
MKAERECQKLQALLNNKIPSSTFKWCSEKDEILLFKIEKRKRERVIIHDDNDEDDEEDEPEVKPKLDVLFKREEDDNDNDNADHNNNVNDNADEDDEDDEDLIRHLSRFSQQFRDVPVTWGDEPQSPWSQHQEHVEQNHVIVPSITEPIAIPNLYTPQGVGLYFLILSFTLSFLVSYKAAGQLTILWKHVEESMLTSMLPSEVYRLLGRDFYMTFNVLIKATHYNYMKQLYGFTNEQLLRSHELDDSFVQQ